MSPGIEVIICTHNGAGRLPAVFKALAAQTFESGLWAVLVVDNASADGTAEQAHSQWTRSDVNLRVVPEPRPGVSMARQRGLAEASREFICFCDDDNLLAPDYLEQAYGLLGSLPRAAALGGQGIPTADQPLPAWFAAAAGGYAVGPQAQAEGPIADSRGYLYGAGMVIRLAAWLPIGAAGFELKLKSRDGVGVNSGEDNEICLLLRLAGWELHYSPRLVFRHLINARKLEEKYCRALYRGFGEASAVLNAYRDFALGRASVGTWRRWALIRALQGRLTSIRDRCKSNSKAPLDAVELGREVDRGFAAGCRELAERGGVFALYREIAARATGLQRPPA